MLQIQEEFMYRLCGYNRASLAHEISNKLFHVKVILIIDPRPNNISSEVKTSISCKLLLPNIIEFQESASSVRLREKPKATIL